MAADQTKQLCLGRQYTCLQCLSFAIATVKAPISTLISTLFLLLCTQVLSPVPSPACLVPCQQPQVHSLQFQVLCPAFLAPSLPPPVPFQELSQVCMETLIYHAFSTRILYISTIIYKAEDMQRFIHMLSVKRHAKIASLLC